MAALILRLSGPLQAWPAPAVSSTRPTHPAPTMSGLVGFMHACLGVHRPAPNEQFNLHRSIRDAAISVRIDQQGQMISDYHTINPLPVSMFEGDPKPPKSADLAVIRIMDGSSPAGLDAKITKRQYLQEAVFTVAVAPVNEEHLALLVEAFRAPRFTPYLGRKGCPPSSPWFLGVCNHVDPLSIIPVVARAGSAAVSVHRLSGPTPASDTAGPVAGSRTETWQDTPAGHVGRDYLARRRHIRTATAPTCLTLEDLLDWAEQNLENR